MSFKGMQWMEMIPFHRAIDTAASIWHNEEMYLKEI